MHFVLQDRDIARAAHGVLGAVGESAGGLVIPSDDPVAVVTTCT